MTSDPGPLARLEMVVADEASPGEVFRLLTERDEAGQFPRLSAIAKQWRVPKGRFVEWFTTKHEALHRAALRVQAADLAADALEEAWRATPETVAVQKLKADVALKLASKYDRELYGEKTKTEIAVVPVPDAGLLAAGADLLRLAMNGQLRIEREVSTLDALPQRKEEERMQI